MPPPTSSVPTSVPTGSAPGPTPTTPPSPTTSPPPPTSTPPAVPARAAPAKPSACGYAAAPRGSRVPASLFAALLVLCVVRRRSSPRPAKLWGNPETARPGCA
jgi:hypothetical protein